ncbi:MAG: heme-binding protein [Bacillota bacterium]|nr:heme-binding protein [Bacillota bacterium]
MNENELAQIVSRVVQEKLCPAEITEMTLALAKRLAARVEEKAKEMGVNPVVAVSNTGARPVLVECTDDSYIASYDVALNKAYTVVALKMPTKTLKTLAQPNEPLYGIQFTNGGQIVIFGGGVPLVHNGKIIGGLGVSGGSEEQDTALADFGGAVLEEEIKCL